MTQMRPGVQPGLILCRSSKKANMVGGPCSRELCVAGRMLREAPTVAHRLHPTYVGKRGGSCHDSSPLAA